MFIASYNNGRWRSYWSAIFFVFEDFIQLGLSDLAPEEQHVYSIACQRQMALLLERDVLSRVL